LETKILRIKYGFYRDLETKPLRIKCGFIGI
jgi:hypothetical protein